MYHMGAIWAPVMYLEIITFPGLFQFYVRVPHIRIILSNFTNMGPIWVIWAKKAYMGPM